MTQDPATGNKGKMDPIEVLKTQGRRELHFALDGLTNNDGDLPLINLTGVPVHDVIDGGAWVALCTERATYKTMTMACRDALLAWCSQVAEGKEPQEKIRLRSESKGEGFRYFRGPPGVRLTRVARFVSAK